MNIIRFEFKRLFKSCLIWSLICGLLMVLFMALFPSMRDSGIQELVGTKLDAFPEGVLDALGLDSLVDFTDIMQYQAYVIQYISMATAIYGAILGSTSLLQEESEGTIEFLYAQPISRNQILTYKALSRVLLLSSFILIFGAINMGISLVYRPDNIGVVQLVRSIKSILAGIYLVGLIFLALGLLLSTSLRASTNFTGISIGIFFISYIFGVASNLRDNLAFLRYLSPFNYALPMNIVREGWEVKYLFVAVGIILLSLLGSYLLYGKKDMEI